MPPVEVERFQLSAGQSGNIRIPADPERPVLGLAIGPESEHGRVTVTHEGEDSMPLEVRSPLARTFRNGITIERPTDGATDRIDLLVYRGALPPGGLPTSRPPYRVGPVETNMFNTTTEEVVVFPVSGRKRATVAVLSASGTLTANWRLVGRNTLGAQEIAVNLSPSNKFGHHENAAYGTAGGTYNTIAPDESDAVDVDVSRFDELELRLLAATSSTMVFYSCEASDD